MAEQMILDGRVVPRRFTLLDGVPAGGVVQPGSILPCHDWQAHRQAGGDVAGVGLTLEGDCDIKALRQVLGEVPVIALHIPKFTDGRCYTHARRIRHHWGYQGDILVFGDVLRDQLIYLWRVGVNAFYMRQDQDLHASLSAFRLYSAFYQYGPLTPLSRGERAA